MVAYFDFFGPRGEVVWYGGGVNLNRPQMAKCREELYVSKRQSRIWFIVAVSLWILTILDLLSVIVENVTTELPDSVRCRLVNAVLSLPFDTEYKSHEREVRNRTNCPAA
ncbi:MAG: hypothetical protein QOI87_3573 [Bradyrhizobium sp.]|jgi:hypothetical protein|nr:hypothetical protein [Bradyrhizobium sp.]